MKYRCSILMQNSKTLKKLQSQSMRHLNQTEDGIIKTN